MQTPYVFSLSSFYATEFLANKASLVTSHVNIAIILIDRNSNVILYVAHYLV